MCSAITLTQWASPPPPVVAGPVPPVPVPPVPPPPPPPPPPPSSPPSDHANEFFCKKKKYINSLRAYMHVVQSILILLLFCNNDIFQKIYSSQEMLLVNYTYSRQFFNFNVFLYFQSFISTNSFLFYFFPMLHIGKYSKL